MSSKNSKIILAKNIKLDKAYNQVMSLTEANMLTLVTTNAVYNASNYSFVRDNKTVQVGASYATCCQCNYMAFQNPYFSNKWFFAFIDNVKYLNDSTTEIEYTVDEWSTWFDYWDPKQCFIIRQHATSDGIGENLVPEKIEFGDYVVNGTNYYGESTFSSYAYLVVLSGLIEQATPTRYYQNMGGTIMNGFVYYCSTPERVDQVIQAANSHQPEQLDVLYVYMIPSVLVPSGNINSSSGLLSEWTTPYSLEKKVLSRPTSIDGYTPVNKKLLCFPYQYCLMNNLSGSSNILHFEDSGYLANTTGLEAGAIYIQYWGVPSIGASVIAIPKYYNKKVMSIPDGLVLGKYPTLGWSEDAFTNWLSQNSVNNTINNARIGLQFATSTGMIAGGLALSSTGAGAGIGVTMMASGVSGLATAGMNAAESAVEYYKHSLEPDSFKGNINAGDVLTAVGAMGFEYVGMCIERPYAEKLDKYFTRFGYMQNAIQFPNMLHRQNYNYIQIAKTENIGYPNNHNNICLPASSMETINNITRRGVTVWNNHTNLGDYSVSNNITN